MKEYVVVYKVTETSPEKTTHNMTEREAEDCYIYALNKGYFSVEIQKL